jgi:hypothetical protein
LKCDESVTGLIGDHSFNDTCAESINGIEKINRSKVVFIRLIVLGFNIQTESASNLRKM